MKFKLCTIFSAGVFLLMYTILVGGDNGDEESGQHTGGEMNSGFVYLQACILFMSVSECERVCVCEVCVWV